MITSIAILTATNKKILEENTKFEAMDPASREASEQKRIVLGLIKEHGVLARGLSLAQHAIDMGCRPK